MTNLSPHDIFLLIASGSIVLSIVIALWPRKRKNGPMCSCFEREFDNPSCPIHRG